MGRAKLKMELIEKEKSRNTTFKKRKEGLIRKLHEFSTLCDVNACMIIYGPNRSTEPEIFPSHDPEKVCRIIDLYKSKNNNNNNNTNSSIKSFGVIDFFHDRKKQIEEEVAKLRRKNLEAKYPTRPELLNALTEPQLRQLHAQLTVKVDQVKTLVGFLKGNAQAASSSITAAMPQSHYSASASAAATDHHCDFGAEMLNDHRRMQQRLNALNHYHPMMVRQFDGGSTSANIQLKHELFFESAAGFYAAPMPPLPQQFLLPPPQHQRPILLPALAQPQQVQYFSNHDEEFIQYHIRNQTAVRNQNQNQNPNQNEEREQDEEEFGVNNFFTY